VNIAIEKDYPFFIHIYSWCTIVISILPCIRLDPIVHTTELMFCLFSFRTITAIFIRVKISNYQGPINIYYAHWSTYES